MKKLAITVACTVLVGCAYHRFQSIATCEFEGRDFMGMSIWISSNCLGNKDADSHVKKSINETKEALKKKQ